MKKYQHCLSDRRKNLTVSNLYIVDSTTITLFDDILKGVGRNPLEGKKKGGLKVHAVLNANVDGYTKIFVGQKITLGFSIKEKGVSIL